jgi:hypothetical protein
MNPSRHHSEDDVALSLLNDSNTAAAAAAAAEEEDDVTGIGRPLGSNAVEQEMINDNMNHNTLVPTIEETPEDLAPLLRSFVAHPHWQLGWAFVKIPILFVVVNVIAIASLLLPNDDRNNYNYDYSHHNHANVEAKKPWIYPAFSNMGYNSMVWGLLLFCDTIVLYLAALYLEQQVTAMRQQQQQQEVSSSAQLESDASLASKYIHAKVSQRVDVFLSNQQGRTNYQRLPEVTFFVNGLYLLTGLSLVASVVSFSMYGFLEHTSKALSVCQRNETLYNMDVGQQNETMDNMGMSMQAFMKVVPETLHHWAWYGTESHGGDGTTSTGGIFIHMPHDGMTYFQGFNRTAFNNDKNRIEEESDMEYDTNDPFIVLFSAARDGTLQSYPLILRPRYFTNWAGPSKEASQGFCCLFTNKTKNNNNNRKGGQVVVITSIACRGEKQPHLRTIDLLQVKEENDNPSMLNRSFSRDTLLQAYQGLLYIRVRWYYHETNARQLEILTLNPQSMNLTSIAKTRNLFDEQSFERDTYNMHYRSSDEHCAHWIDGVKSVVGVPLLFLVAHWLVKLRDIPAGMTLLCLGVYILASIIFWKNTHVFGAVTSVAATISLLLGGTTTTRNSGSALPPWMSREMVLWGLYTTLIVSAVASPDFWCCWRLPIGIVCLGAVIGVILNHPVLQILGGVGAVATVLLVVVTIVAPEYSMNYFEWGLWTIAPSGLVISCGIFSLSFSIQKYRFYLVAYLRRVWRILQLASTNRTAGRRGGSGSTRYQSGNNDGAALSTRDY